MDRAWWKVYFKEVQTNFRGQTYSPITGLYNVNKINFKHYRNSGAGAIALAAHFGAKRIVLLGYDCQHTGGKKHWHGDHPSGLGNAGSLWKWKEHFEEVARDFSDLEIINCSRETALDCFPRQTLEEALADDARPDMVVNGMLGLGDNLYQRAFVQRIPATVYLHTPWPQLYADLPNVRPVQMETRLRTQSKNLQRCQVRWHEPPRHAPIIRVAYGGADMRTGSIPRAMARRFGVAQPAFNLPPVGDSPIKADRPVAIVRPVTARREWLNTARNPRPEYIAQAATELRRRGYFVVSLADLQDGEEWIEGEAPEADLVLHKGELDVMQLLSAVKHAALVVGGVGWIVPACISAGTPLYCVMGGQLGHNAPERLVDDKLMDASMVGWAWPDAPCGCTSKTHNCNKVIDGFHDRFCAWLDRRSILGLPAGQADLVA
ncbi:MAG: hypothetical protein H5U29_00210 [Pusillimonas sp.]|nr:hypothetical protein [Pusillimonas sp.]